MNSKIFAIVTAFLTVTILVAVFAFIYVSTFLVTGESLLPFRRDNSVAPTMGAWVGNTYTSEYLGVRFEMPQGWIRIQNDFLAAEQPAFPEFEPGEDPPRESWFVDQLIVVMSTADPETLTGVDIAFERLMPRSRISAAAYIEQLAELLEERSAEADIPIIINTDFSDTVEIGNYEWHQMTTESDVEYTILHTHRFININRGFARVITITYRDDEYLGDPNAVANVLAMLTTLPEYWQYEEPEEEPAPEYEYEYDDED